MYHGQKKQFSLYRRLRSFRFAFRGIYLVRRNQVNFKIHLVALFVVVIFGILFQVSIWEWCIIILTCALVLSLEAVNTALEYFVDMVSPDFREKAGEIKDIAAGAVLLSAIAALIVGSLIFLPKLFHLLFHQ